MHIEILDGTCVKIDGQNAGILQDVLINHPEASAALWAAARLEISNISQIQRALADAQEQVKTLEAAAAAIVAVEAAAVPLTEAQYIDAQVKAKLAAHYQTELDAKRELIVAERVEAALAA